MSIGECYGYEAPGKGNEHAHIVSNLRGGVFL